MSRSTRIAQIALVLALAPVALGGCHKSAPAAGTAESTTAAAELPALTIQQVADKIDRHDRLAVFDVNNHNRYTTGHVPGAVWVPEQGVTAEILPPDKSTPLVFYCANTH